MIYEFLESHPVIHDSCFIAESADVIGDVSVNEYSSIWFGTVIRGDTNKIFIGKETNIQDNCTIHVNRDNGPVYIGNGVTIGHGAIIHGCTINDNSLIGMGAIILDGAVIGKNTIIGAGTIVTGGKEIPDGVLCFGSPGRVIRNLTEKEIDDIRKDGQHYVDLAKKFKSK